MRNKVNKIGMNKDFYIESKVYEGIFLTFHFNSSVTAEVDYPFRVDSAVEIVIFAKNSSFKVTSASPTDFYI